MLVSMDLLVCHGAAEVFLDVCVENGAEVLELAIIQQFDDGHLGIIG